MNYILAMTLHLFSCYMEKDAPKIMISVLQNVCLLTCSNSVFLSSFADFMTNVKGDSISNCGRPLQIALTAYPLLQLVSTSIVIVDNMRLGFNS